MKIFDRIKALWERFVPPSEKELERRRVALTKDYISRSLGGGTSSVGSSMVLSEVTTAADAAQKARENFMAGSEALRARAAAELTQRELETKK